jgi:ribonuclease J
MMKDIAIVAVGGYNEIGRNMTAIRIGKDIVVMDMGIRLDRVQIHEDTDVESLHANDLIAMGAIPDDSIMNSIDGKVRAIACTHGHLDFQTGPQVPCTNYCLAFYRRSHQPGDQIREDLRRE